jgi:hypothetical protein
LQPPSRRGLAALALAGLATLGGCDEDGGRPAPGPGPGGDAGFVDPFADADQDGLCDLTETEVFFTDPMNPDTDGDGLADRVEVENGYSPRRDTVPSLDQLVFLAQRPAGTTQRTFTIGVDVEPGSNVQAGLLAVETGDLDALPYLTGVRAVAGFPEGRVAVTKPDEGYFGGVAGRVDLVFEMTVTFPEDRTVEDCARAFPFDFLVQNVDTSEIVDRRILTLVTLPAEDTLFTTTFCPVDTCF